MTKFKTMDNFLEDLHGTNETTIAAPKIMELLNTLPITKEEEEVFLSEFRQEAENGKSISIFKRISQLCKLFEDTKNIANIEALEDAKGYENAQLKDEYKLERRQKTTYYYNSSNEYVKRQKEIDELKAQMKLAHKSALNGETFVDKETGEIIPPATTQYSKEFLSKV